MKTPFRLLVVTSVVAVYCAAPALAQNPVPTGTCVTPTYAGGDGRPHPCTIGSSRSSRGSSSGSYSGPSAADIEAERAREAERKRLEELQRQAELERQRREAEQKRAQEEFLREVQAAAGQLKGVSGGQVGLKGVGDNTPFFGLKGVSPEEAAAHINTSRPDASARDVSTASKQLTCAFSITNSALTRVSNVVAGTGTDADMDEIKYLAGEAINALQGDPVGVQCNSTGALKFTKAPDLKTLTPAYKNALNRMVRDSQQLYDIQQRAAAAQQKLEEAKSRLAELKQQSTSQSRQTSDGSQTTAKSVPSAGDAAVDKAYAEQKAWQQKDQEKINQVYEQQKKMQQQQFDALALLRKAQAEYNAVNSQKVGETKALTEDAKAIAGLESGNAPQK